MSLPLRIGLLMHSVLPRGGVVHTLELADALAARGHRVTVIAPVEPGQALFRTPACELALIPMQAPVGDLVEQVDQRITALQTGLQALVAAQGFDLLHAQDSLNGNALARLADAGARLPPWLRTVHHLDDFPQPRLAAWQARGWRDAAAVACVSALWCKRLHAEHGVVARRVFNGVNLRRFQPARAAGDATTLQALGLDAHAGPLCLAVGGVESRKNSARLLQAFARLRAADPAWAGARLVIAGGASLLDHRGALVAWQRSLEALGLAEGPGQPVWRTGPLPDAVLPVLMRRATLLAMPSLVEGFGLVALEALACGTPVLVSQRPPFTEHLAGNEAVAWCDPEDVASIARGLQRAACLPRPTAPPAVCHAHSWARSAAAHEAWYASVLARSLSIPPEDPPCPPCITRFAGPMPAPASATPRHW